MNASTLAESLAPAADAEAAGRPSILSACLSPRAAIPRTLVIGITGAVWLGILAFWSYATYGGLMSPLFLPTPGAVVQRALALAADGTLLENTCASVEVVLIGFVISSVIAVPLGLLLGTFRVVQAAIEPLVNFIRYLPVTSFVPLFILWIGIGLDQRVAVIFFGTFFQQLVMIADVVRNVPDDLLNASYTLGASRRDVLLHVLAPAAKPGIIDTLRVTMAWAWTYLVVAEMVGASAGLGYISLKAMRGFQVDTIFLAIAVIGLLGLFTDLAFRFIRARFVSWAQ